MELDPDARKALDAVFEQLDARTDLPDPLRSTAEELLIIQAEYRPRPLVRALKPEGWAAGALHAAHMELRGRRGAAGMTQRDLGRWFGVSTGTVSLRSRDLRETAAAHHFWPSSDGERFLRRLAAELEAERLRMGEEARGPDATGPEKPGPDADPDGRVEALLLAGETSGAQAAYRRAAAVLEAHAEGMDREVLEYLLRRGLENAAGEAKRRLLALAVRHFGTAVGTWAPEGARRWL